MTSLFQKRWIFEMEIKYRHTAFEKDLSLSHKKTQEKIQEEYNWKLKALTKEEYIARQLLRRELSESKARVLLILDEKRNRNAIMLYSPSFLKSMKMECVKEESNDRKLIITLEAFDRQVVADLKHNKIKHLLRQSEISTQRQSLASLKFIQLVSSSPTPKSSYKSSSYTFQYSR
eukprot:NODE_6344_length_897_cov_2.080103_g5752_i0.p1 GENE.NODE_6344_length_897_cov_2.080103_g5752_i0~~NODE_6344_length_897_cov_2.080103_g5752_i0.p1  ORF type:complete len:185 (+),score=29.90 NODE_6344_length_897_cov_2.080103_g5752_i0:31-555(+)